MKFAVPSFSPAPAPSAVPEAAIVIQDLFVSILASRNLQAVLAWKDDDEGNQFGVYAEG